MFADTLADRGVEVLYLHELLSETLEQETAHAALDRPHARNLAARAAPDRRGRRRGSRRCRLRDLAEVAIAGIAFDEVPFHSRSLPMRTARPGDFLLSPLPNHLFTRDTSAWIYDGVCVNSMAKQARAREAINLDIVYRSHPLFAAQTFPIWSDWLGSAAMLEGGDVLVIGNGCVLIGMGERTRPAAVEELAQGLFTAGAARKVIAVVLPKRRSAMHLDTVMTMVDWDAFTIYPELRENLAGYVLSPDGEGLVVHQAVNVFDAVAAALDVERAAADRDGRRPLRGGARAVGRRQQRARRRARCRRRLRAQCRHEHPAAPARHRGHHDPRRGAGAGPRRPPVHVLSGRARACRHLHRSRGVTLHESAHIHPHRSVRLPGDQRSRRGPVRGRARPGRGDEARSGRLPRRASRPRRWPASSRSRRPARASRSRPRRIAWACCRSCCGPTSCSSAAARRSPTPPGRWRASVPPSSSGRSPRPRSPSSRSTRASPSSTRSRTCIIPARRSPTC